MEIAAESYQNHTLRDYVRILFRQKGVILATIIAITGTVFLGLSLQTAVYEAQVKMLISAEKKLAGPYFRELLQYRQTEMTLTQSEILKSNSVLERVVTALDLANRTSADKDVMENSWRFSSQGFGRLGKVISDWSKTKFSSNVNVNDQNKAFLAAVAKLKKNIKVEPIRNTDTFILRVKNPDPVQAATIANSISRSYVIFDLEQQLAELQLKYGPKHSLVSQLAVNIEQMKENLNGQVVSNLEAIGPASVKIIEQASIPLTPTGIPKILVLAAALLVSLIIGPLLAFLFESFDSTFKSPNDTASYLHLPLLGFVPKKRLFHREDKKQFLYEHLYFLIKLKGLKSLMMAPLDPSTEGIVHVMANFSRYFAEEAGLKVLLIDANVRNPSLHHAFKISNKPGLSDVLAGSIFPEEAVQEIDEHISVLPAGEKNEHAVTLLHSERMKETMIDLKEKYDAVFLTSSDLNNYHDAIILSSYVDATVFVINEGETRRQSAKVAVDAFRQERNSVLGVIHNNRTFDIPAVIYEKL